jgi:hypothetical protein
MRCEDSDFFRGPESPRAAQRDNQGTPEQRRDLVDNTRSLRSAIATTRVAFHSQWNKVVPEHQLCLDRSKEIQIQISSAEFDEFTSIALRELFATCRSSLIVSSFMILF